MKKNKISNAVIRRLPRYLRHLAAMRREGQERTSSSALGSRMGLTASQIRQDLSCFGEFGQQGYGYNVETLYRELREILYLNQEKDAVLVGVGNLGHALIRNFRFRESGIRLCAAFDADPALVGSSINGVTVEDAAGLSAYLARHPTTVAVLTLPGRYAQQTAELLMEGGVKGIWNFTGFDVEVPGRFSDVVIESVHFSDSLQVLNYLIGGGERETE